MTDFDGAQDEERAAVRSSAYLEDDEAGDSACWAHRVCPACGRLNEAEHPYVCEACGADFGADFKESGA